MRKNAGFMIMTLLLLTVPALANAWTLAVKVAGGTDTNNVAVSYSYKTGTQGVDEITKTATSTFKSTSSYMYPIGPVTVAAAPGFTAGSLTLDGLPVVNGVQVPTSGNHILAVAYAATVTNFSVNLTQDPNGGGQIYAENKNNTWTLDKVTGLVASDIVPIAIAADANHKILSYTIGAVKTNVVNGTAGQVISKTATAGDAVTATFGVAGQTTATLFAPTNGTTGVAISLNVTATSNDSPLTYAFAVSPAPAKAGVQAGSSFAFTPSSATTYTVTATVTSPNMVAPVVQTASIDVADAIVNANQACVSCHSTQSPTIVANYNASIHSNSAHSACSACHTTATPHSANINALNVNPATFACATTAGAVAKGKVFCTACHNPLPHSSALAGKNTCVQCHTAATGVAGKGDAHQIQGLSCVGCHAVGQTNPFSDKTLVNDNAGVRAVVGEFGKWSHHIVNAPGVALQDEQCAVCHLEGTVGTYGFGVDGTKHMTDAVTHLRNADTDADLPWDPAAPNHSNMDTFCMSCHDANGATSPMNVKLQALITPLTGTTASASNPFGDTISNQYDKMRRPAVVNVDSQFNTGNNSHHGVKGKRYSGRTRFVLPEGRLINTYASFANNSSANLPGKRTTIFDAGKFNQLYVPLKNDGGEAAPRTGALPLGDDSTLHCGDCHTVGQWKAGSATNASGFNTYSTAAGKNTLQPAIGAHGSNNEYMLRNSIGSDARHQGIKQNAAKGLISPSDSVTPYLVCYNCHAIANYGMAAHVGEQVSENNCNFVTNTNTVSETGSARLMSQFTNTIGTLVAGTNSGANYSNIFGIQCNNCHNSGISAGNIFGGIHGSADATYKDGAGNTTKHERFLPGLGNVMYVPGTRGGVTGGTTAYVSYSSAVQKTGISTGLRFKGQYGYTTGGVTNDTNWEEKTRIPVGDGVTGWSHNPGAAGCYTITAGDDEPYSAEGNGVPGGPAASKGLTAPDGTLLFGAWGGCDDHSQSAGSSVRQPRSGNTSIRPVTY